MVLGAVVLAEQLAPVLRLLQRVRLLDQAELDPAFGCLLLACVLAGLRQFEVQAAAEGVSKAGLWNSHEGPCERPGVP